ncbi:hypothetical protein CBM2625_A180071 [Cupriavidus taiwanensis]|uniref:Uncharacterized protein n=1 Tax=Cupriavidus taiwanensis TaxID=164546 RepID=A0A375IX82_9BURK|nr:hypothetical protein CBM2625_A180071 [Cupriavidus taiwanensis]SPR97584.1 hypothetical protein CBM2634_A180004 [Cupriavidus taiwanensis]
MRQTYTRRAALQVMPGSQAQ